MDAAVISGGDTLALAAAGVLAGLVGSAGGITSLVSYPALLAVGLPALGAAVANNVALVACWPGSALGSRPELRGRLGWLRAWLPLAAAGGAAGAAILIATPPGTFSRIVPFLVAAGAVALLVEPRLTARRRRRHARSWRLALPFGLLAVSFYNGYFGAGAGVMTLVLVLVLAQPHLATANALKNMLIGAGSAASAVVFIASASVQWRATLPLGLGMLVGSRAGPVVARRLPPGLLRWLIAAVGLALAIRLFIAPT